jgi:hypothetical protein
MSEQQYQDLGDFIPLCESMMQQNPDDRPTASGALAALEALVVTMDYTILCHPIDHDSSNWYQVKRERQICGRVILKLLSVAAIVYTLLVFVI